jgi:hypothetical protein
MSQNTPTNTGVPDPEVVPQAKRRQRRFLTRPRRLAKSVGPAVGSLSGYGRPESPGG